MNLWRIFVPIAIVSLSGCKSFPPKEFVGAWEFDSQKTEAAIWASDLDEEGKLKVSNSYIHMNRGQVWVISEDGYSWFEEAPEQTRLPLNIKKIEDGTIYVLEDDQGAREVGEDYQPIVFEISVSGDSLEIHEDETLGFNTFYMRKR